MSKKMKQAALVTSPAYACSYEDYNYNKISSKHQVLLQEYHDLLKDADNMKNKLVNAKQRKLVLLAEVRFLRKRHKYLLKTRALNLPQEQHITIENQPKLSKKESALHKRETTQFKLPPLPDLKHKGRVYAGKEGAMKNMAPLPPLDLNRKVTPRPGKEAVASGLTHQGLDSSYRKRISSMKEAGVPNVETATSMNQNEKKYQGGNGNGFGSSRLQVFDLNQDTSFSGKETGLPTRGPPIFDLNEISMEEEEVQNNYELMEPIKKGGLLKAGNEDQTTDMKLSLCRNAGEGSSRMGKRKISWQDPVALRV